MLPAVLGTTFPSRAVIFDPKDEKWSSDHVRAWVDLLTRLTGHPNHSALLATDDVQGEGSTVIRRRGWEAWGKSLFALNFSGQPRHNLAVLPMTAADVQAGGVTVGRATAEACQFASTLQVPTLLYCPSPLSSPSPAIWLMGGAEIVDGESYKAWARFSLGIPVGP